MARDLIEDLEACLVKTPGNYFCVTAFTHA